MLGEESADNLHVVSELVAAYVVACLRDVRNLQVRHKDLERFSVLRGDDSSAVGVRDDEQSRAGDAGQNRLPIDVRPIVVVVDAEPIQAEPLFGIRPGLELTIRPAGLLEPLTGDQILFIMLRQPPRPTLFPYPTLVLS